MLRLVSYKDDQESTTNTYLVIQNLLLFLDFKLSSKAHMIQKKSCSLHTKVKRYTNLSHSDK